MVDDDDLVVFFCFDIRVAKREKLGETEIKILGYKRWNKLMVCYVYWVRII
jgi:hypothetical protein